MEENTQSEYTYYAFISYKREDEKWAKWLQKKLESYGFPVALRKDNPSLPSKIRPIFRDQSELSGGNLKEEIEKGLQGSKYLIVICSPRAAQSPWVSKEVRYFIDNDRENNIIPFIIGGSPNAKNPEDECFPEGLRQLSGEKEILGININEMGRDAAAIKVIAHMFDLRFDTLWQRHERAKRRKRFAVIAGVLAFALISIAVAGVMFDLKQQADTNAQIAKKESARANKERDNALQANKSLELANDSIKKQSAIIIQTNIDLAQSKKNLEQSNHNLAESNRRLAEERDNVKKANWKMMENQGRAVAEKAKELIRNGNVVTGASLAYQMLPNKINPKDRPYVTEAEQSLRAAYDSIMYGQCPYVLLEQHGQVLSMTFNNDDKYLLTTSNDQMARLWNTQTGREITDCPLKHNQSVLNALFGPSPNEIMTFLYNGEVNLWDLKNKTKYVFENVRGTNPILNSDGTILAIKTKKNKKTIYQLWDTKNWCELMSLNTSDMAFFNHKLQIAYIKDNEIIICDYSGNILSRWPITDSQLVYSLTLSPDDKELLVCTSDTLSLWDIKNQRKTYVYSGERLNGAKFSSDGNYIVTHSEWGNVNFFDVSELQEKPTHIIQYNASVEDAMFSPQLSSFAEFNYAEGIVRLYRNPMNQRREQLFEHIYHTNNDIYLSTNENHIITVDNDYVILEDIAQGTKEMIKNPFAERKISSSGNTYYLNMINEIHYSPKMGYWAIIAKSDKKVHVYTRNMEKELLVIPTDAQIFTLSFSKDSKYLAIGCRDKNVYIWDLHANQCYAKFTGHQNGVTSVSFSDDNKYVISGSFDNTIRVWSMKERKEILDKRDATEYDLNSVALSPDNKYYIYADKHLVHIKDFSTKKEIYSLNITDAQTVFFSQDGKHIYMLRGDYNLDDYDGNHIVRLPFPSFDDIYDFFTPFFLKYSLSEEEKIKYFMK